jgi:manganese/zinc/iron transport system permease protein
MTGRRTLLILALMAMAASASAARIGDVVEGSSWEQASRFLSLRDTSVRLALAGSVLLGLSCGLFGAFLVVRRLALVGDVLSHAVLPGVTAGFLWNTSKDPIAIFVGATVAGVLGTACVTWILRTTKLKEDTALALVLSVFFAVGSVMMGIIQNLPTAAKSGVDKCLFGQAAALSATDLKLMIAVTVTEVGLLAIFYKELLVLSFDAAFARAIGLPVSSIHHIFMFLLSAAVVVALQAVGVVLISAMLITPAAAAYLLTSRMHKMLLISAIIGITGSVLGAFFSFLRSNLPTGPCMVVATSGIFVLVLLFSPLHGLVPHWFNRARRSRRTNLENALKNIFAIGEQHGSSPASATLADLQSRSGHSAAEVSEVAVRLATEGLAVLEQNRSVVRLSEEGQRLAADVVRKHRLWELYLTEQANYRSDHVHADAEEIEHILGEEAIKMLERRLGYPQRDPHGRAIPRPQ